MMKGVIVVDFPKFCIECNFCRELDEGIHACCEMMSDPDDYRLCRDIEDYCQDKPEWCPIVPLTSIELINPKDKLFKSGWDACIKKITEGK